MAADAAILTHLGNLMKLAFDLSSVLWTCLRAGKDTEGQEVIFSDKKHWVNTAEFGYERAVNLMVAALNDFNLTPIDAIIVQEGVASKSPRLAICPLYKSKRDKKPEEEYAQFIRLRTMIVDLFSKLGAITVIQDYAEGDDVLGWLALHTEEDLIICTNDNDMSVLNGVNTHGANVGVRVNGLIGQNSYGNFPHKYISLYKAFVGDTSDSISGIPGFGDKAWEQLYSRFGNAGLDLLIGMIARRSLDELYEDSTKDKFVKRIYEGAADLIRCYKLASIYPEWVDTMNNPLQWKPGMCAGAVTDERVRHWAATRRLVTASRFGEFASRALAQIAKRPWLALDIEGSTPAESDDWLEAQEDPNGVDTIGSTLSGMSLTFGDNMQHTVYIPVDHADTDCVSSDNLRDFIKSVADTGVEIVIHNTNYEGPVLHNAWGEAWKDNGYSGFLPNWMDTKFCASYVDENDRLGLKHLSKRWLNYDQVDYDTVTTMQGVGLTGGKFLGEVRVVDQAAEVAKNEDGFSVTVAAEVFHMEERRQYKMRDLSARQVFDYACDDTVTTAALYNFFKLFMSLEHTFHILKAVEIKASYAHAQSFTHGFKIDLAKMAELSAIDDATYDKAWQTLQGYLVAQGWAGTVCPTIETLDAKTIKLAYQIIIGEPLETMVRTPDKLCTLIEVAGHHTLSGTVRLALSGDVQPLQRMVTAAFSGTPVFNPGSPKQMVQLLYTTMGLPISVYNKPTEAMKERGVYQGTPSTDALAIAYGLRDAPSKEVKEAIQALQLMKMVSVRRGLYYKAYPYFIHWKTGRIHSSHNQCATNTRRASSSKPNMQQMPKHPKVEGQPARFREVLVPHKRNAVVVSMDFVAQELRVIADYTQDPNLLACYVGEALKDMHTFTGLGIVNSSNYGWSYEDFVTYLNDTDSPMYKVAKAGRALGKKLNFTAEYGAMADKVAATLLISKADAQTYLDARDDMFPVAKEWKRSVIAEAKGCGFVRTKLGAVRHLRAAFMSNNRTESSKAERQAVNTKIQGSSAEMTKLAEGRCWDAKLEERFDCEIIGPIHDELAASCAIEDLYEFIPAMHACMVANYADMKVPILSSISFGPSFGVQIEIGDQPTREAVDFGLAKLKEMTA